MEILVHVVVAMCAVHATASMSQLECGYRKLAYEKALHMHPWRKSGRFARQTFDALQLQECNQVPPALIQSTKPHNKFKPNQWSPLDVLVDAVVGDDVTGDGSLRRPFRSVERALQHVRSLQNEGATLHLAPGLHFLNGTEMLLDSRASGTTIKSAGTPGKTIIFPLCSCTLSDRDQFIEPTCITAFVMCRYSY